MKKTNIVKAIIYGASILPFVAFAQIVTPGTLPSGLNNTYTSYTQIGDTLNTVVNWLFGILLVLGIGMIIVAAFFYATAAGNDERVKKAKKTLTYAIIAIALAVLSKGIVAVIQGFLINRGTQ